MLCASHSCKLIQCVFLDMFRVMRAEFGYWLSIRLEWFGRTRHSLIYACSPHMHTNNVCTILVLMYPNCYMFLFAPSLISL